jgi:hypothetical protein
VPASIRSRARIRKNSPHGKISAALVELILPFIEDDMSLEGYRNVVGVGAIAWNLSLMEDSKIDDAAELLETQDDEQREWFKTVVSDLIARKKRLFPKDQRYIAGWEVSLTPDGRHRVTAAGAGVE